MKTIICRFCDRPARVQDNWAIMVCPNCLDKYYADCRRRGIKPVDITLPPPRRLTREEAEIIKKNNPLLKFYRQLYGE